MRLCLNIRGLFGEIAFVAYKKKWLPRDLRAVPGWFERLATLSGLSYIPQLLPIERKSGRLGNWEVGKLLCDKA